MRLIIAEHGALGGYVSREFYHTINHLINEHGWYLLETMTPWMMGGSFSPKLDRLLPCKPQAVLFWEGFQFMDDQRELEELDCLKAVYCDDLHCYRDEDHQRKLRCFAQCDLIFAAYAPLFSRYFPTIPANRVIWSPHAVSSDFALPFNEHPKNEVYLSGAVTRDYRLRCHMRALHQAGNPHISWGPHPGYHCYYQHGNEPAVGRGYARRLAARRAAFSDGIYQYLVAKFFEIPACGSLLLAARDMTGFLAQQGLHEGTHFLSVDLEDMERMIAWIVDEANHDEIDKIRRSARQYIWQHHTTAHRARAIDLAVNQALAKQPTYNRVSAALSSATGKVQLPD